MCDSSLDIPFPLFKITILISDSHVYVIEILILSQKAEEFKYDVFSGIFEVWVAQKKKNVPQEINVCWTRSTTPNGREHLKKKK